MFPITRNKENLEPSGFGSQRYHYGDQENGNTTKWEKDMQKIASGETEQSDVLVLIRHHTGDVWQVVRRKTKSEVKSKEGESESGENSLFLRLQRTKLRRISKEKTA